MPRRLDIGICSYGADPAKLLRAVESVQRNSVTDWRLFIIHNPSEGDERTIEAISRLVAEDARIIHTQMGKNVGYAGAVNEFFDYADTEYLAYLDFDTEIQTPGWDEALCSYLDRFHELGIVFPNWGHSAIPRGPYHEVLWAAGFCWVISRMAQRAAGWFDTTLGHHEEVDYCTRLKLEGYKLACAPEVQVAHHETSTRSPESQERISKGVIAWMNKWVAYFGGKNLNYYSPNVLRILDWNVHALHMEEYFRLKLPGLNDDPETIRMDDGSEWDLIRVPRPRGFYTGRYV